MAFCIGFARVEFPFSEGPLLTQPRCIILSSGFPSVLSPPASPPDICILSKTGRYLNFCDLNLFKFLCFPSQIIDGTLLSEEVGGQELNPSSTDSVGLFGHSISYHFRAMTSAVLLHIIFRKISRKTSHR